MHAHPHTSRLMTLSALVIAAGTLTACKVGPDYSSPDTRTPQQFNHAGADGFADRSAPRGDRPPEVLWWSTLKDAKLDDLIQRAVAGNLDVKLATARIRETRAQRGIVDTEALPAFTVNSNYQRDRFSQQGRVGRFSNAGDIYTASFDASWEIDVWGRNARDIDAADADIDQSIENRRDVFVTLFAEIARNYVEHRSFQRRLDIARKNIDLQRQTLELTNSRFKAGLTNEVDVAQARANLATTEATVARLDQGLHVALHRLGVLLGQEPGFLEHELAEYTGVPQPPDEVPLGVPSELLRRRPDIRRAERELAGFVSRIGVATADLFPRFSLTGTFGFQSISLANIGNADARFWSFGPAVRWPVFQFGRLRAAVGVANARADQALVRYEQTVLTSFEDVENTLVAFTREQSRRRALQEAVDSNRRGFDLSTQLYTNGLTDFLRVLESQRALQISEDQLYESDATVTTNLIALYKALGGGWQALEPQPTSAEHTGG